MENIIGDFFKDLLTIYISYVIILTFIITTITYCTYRFWKMILPNENEIKVFITNAPVIGHSYNDDSKE